MKIALVGEAPTDTKSIANLLSKRWNEGFIYYPLINRIRGSMLDDQKTKTFLRKEYAMTKPDIVVFIRDLDGFSGDKQQQKNRQAYFSESNSVVDKKGVYLLSIYEIEALILTDLESIKKQYNIEVKLTQLPEEIKEPKEFLKKKCKSYSELNNAEIFSNLDFDKVLEHPSFFKFIKGFEKAIA